MFENIRAREMIPLHAWIVLILFGFDFFPCASHFIDWDLFVYHSACINLLLVAIVWKSMRVRVNNVPENEHRISEIDINKRNVCFFFSFSNKRNVENQDMSCFPLVDWLSFYVNKKTNDSYVFLIDLTRIWR